MARKKSGFAVENVAKRKKSMLNVAKRKKTVLNVTKRKKSVLSLENKIKILDKLRSGLSNVAVGREFGINESTVRSIRNKESEIRKSVSESASCCAKVTAITRGIALEKMEKRLNLWRNQMMIERKCFVNSIALRQKALSIYAHVTKDDPKAKPFSASRGWFEKFKRRYNLPNLKRKRKETISESCSPDIEAVEEFNAYAYKLIKEKHYRSEQVFNVDETDLFYKQVGNQTYVIKEVSKLPGLKSFKDRATLLLCTNAKGDFKCKPLMVYHARSPRALKGKNLSKMPVHWRWNRKAWMTGEIFFNWFNHCFVPEVEKYLQHKNLAFKVLLIMDNAPVHCREELENAHPNVKVVFIPSNVSSVIQPLDQGIIKVFKSHYIQELYRAACQHLEANHKTTMRDYWKSMTICNVIDFVHLAWDSLSDKMINNCWKKILPCLVKNSEGFFTTVESNIQNTVQNIIQLSKQIGGEGFENIQTEDVENILNQRAAEPTNEELDIMIGEDLCDSEEEDDEQEKVPKLPMTVSKLSRIYNNIDSLCKELEESDPILERSLKFKRIFKAAWLPYAEVLKDLNKKSRQATLTEFFKTVPYST